MSFKKLKESDNQWVDLLVLLINLFNMTKAYKIPLCLDSVILLFVLIIKLQERLPIIIVYSVNVLLLKEMFLNQEL